MRIPSALSVQQHPLLFGCILANVLAPAGARADPNLGLVARYRCETLEDGVLKDDSGKGNHLRAQGTVSLEPGKFGQAVRIGRAGYAQAAKSDSLELGGELTLEAWIRPEANPPSGMRILDRQTIGGNDGFMLDTWPEGHLRLIIAPGVLRAADPIPVGEWTHVAATYSETTGEMRLFMNGRVVAEGFASGRLRPSAHPLNVGASQGGGDRFHGLIGDPRITHRALDPDEIAAHAQGKEIEPPATATAGLEPLPVLTKNDKPQVDYAALCARNDLVYLRPARHPFEAMHLGNGNLGVCQWNAGGMAWQINNGRYRLGNEPVSSGKVTLTTPALAQERPARFEERLRLWDGVVTTRSEGPAGTAAAATFVAEGEDCLVFHCNESGAGPRVLRLHLWRDGAHFVKGPDWVAVTEHAPHQEEFLATDMALLVKVEGARVTAGQDDPRTLTLTFKDAPADYTVYVANALTRDGEEGALLAAHQVIARVQAKGYAQLLEERKAFWHAFWPRSFLHLTSRNGEADFLENLWYLFHYDLASMSRNTLCPKFNGGNWLVHEDHRWWGGNYWHQNTREIFWPVYASNHTDLSDPFFDLYWRMTDRARERGRGGFNADGFHFGECVPLDGGGIPKAPLTPGYGAHILTVGLEVALQAWWRYEYTGDEAFLRERVLPLLRGCLDFYLAYAKKGPDGKYHLEPANAQETYWAVKNPHQDLAALRWAIPLALELSRKVGADAALRARWQDLLENLAPYPVDPVKDVFRQADLKPTDKANNSENVENYGIYPFGVFGIGLPEYERAKNTFLNRPVQGMGNGWEPAAIAAARLGLADEAAKLELAHLYANMRFNNGGWYSPTAIMWAGTMPDVPYFDSPGVSAQALNEMALQSHAGLLRLAPAWPAKWDAQFRLRARGGFLVTAEVHAGTLRYALVESEWGGPCRLANPWGATAVVTCAGKAVLRSDKPVLEFATAKGKVYRVERAGAPLAAMKFAPLAPAPAAGAKFIGRRLPAWPNWNQSPFLGIDAEGRTPQRAAILRAVEGFRKRLSEATAGLADLSTGRAAVTVTQAKGEALPAPALVDGEVGGVPSVEVPAGQCVLLDLGAPRAVGALVFSRDRTGVMVDAPVRGYTLEGSPDGTAWTMLLDKSQSGAAPAGQVEPLQASARYLRLRLTGQYGRGTRLDEVTVWGK